MDVPPTLGYWLLKYFSLTIEVIGIPFLLLYKTLHQLKHCCGINKSFYILTIKPEEHFRKNLKKIGYMGIPDLVCLKKQFSMNLQIYPPPPKWAYVFFRLLQLILHSIHCCKIACHEKHTKRYVYSRFIHPST